MTTDLDRAVDALRSGGLVAIPTETVYGLAADADDDVAVRRIFQVKGRPAGHPLIVHLASAEGLPEWASTVPETAALLATACWPGPLTAAAAARGSGVGRRDRRSRRPSASASRRIR